MRRSKEVSASGRSEAEGAGVGGVVVLAGWYNAASGRAGPARKLQTFVGSAGRACRLKRMGTEPWYGVRLVYRLTGFPAQAYEERIVIVRADSFDEAIAKAERYSKDYEDETKVYTGYAMAFHILDEDGSSLGEGVEVFSLMRDSDLDPDEYLDRFHDTGRERAKHTGERS